MIPTTGIWSLTGSLNNIRGLNTATLLPDGKVLVVGAGITGTGWSKFAELYDPATGTWSLTGNPFGGDGALTLLSDGLVLAEGGINIFAPRDTAELYDPASGIWSLTSSLHRSRGAQTATLLPSGEVLVAGGRHVN